MRIPMLLVCGLTIVPVLLAQNEGLALVRHAPALNGAVVGSIHVMTAENVALGGNADIQGDLLVPGTPAIRLNGNPTYAGTSDGQGSANPANHTITLGGGSKLRHVVRRTDAVSLPTVATPPQPAGTRSVTLNNPGQSPGDFATLKDLTLNGNAGQITVPAGAYGRFTVSSGSSLVLGTAGATTPAVYDFQELVLNGNSSLAVAGPVVVTVKGDIASSGSLGEAAHPAWLRLRLAEGGLTLNGGSTAYARLEAPAGTLTLNGGSRFVGTVAVERLSLNGSAKLELIAPPDEPPAFPDTDHDNMDDRWESANGLNPLVDDASLDNDRDGIANLIEFQLGLKPNNADTDGDGLYDGDEIALGLDPTKANPDTQPPTAPAGLAKGAVSTDSVTLSWQPASDDLKVSGYLVYRDGQPIETEQPIRGTTFTDTNLPDGEEFTYQVRAFDFAGNLSPMGGEIFVTTVAADTDQDGLPDEWELKYFGEDPSAPADDADGDGQTNLQEFQAGTDPTNFYNGIDPVTEALHGSAEGANGEIAMMVRKPDGTPWVNAPYNFDSSSTRRKISAAPGGPFEVYQLTVRAGADGIARCYLEPLNR